MEKFFYILTLVLACIMFCDGVSGIMHAIERSKKYKTKNKK